MSVQHCNSAVHTTALLCTSYVKKNSAVLIAVHTTALYTQQRASYVKKTALLSEQRLLVYISGRAAGCSFFVQLCSHRALPCFMGAAHPTALFIFLRRMYKQRCWVNSAVSKNSAVFFNFPKWSREVDLLFQNNKQRCTHNSAVFLSYIS